jgi:protocatechuate 3,4-dioxygenase beta subunit
MTDRRSFLQSIAILGLATGRGRASDDPVAALSPEIWRNARRNGLVMIRHPAPDGTTSHATLVKPGEPGDPLAVTGQVFVPDGKTPAAGVTVYAYNTDAQGYYGENRTGYPPRIYGWMKSDSAGRFDLATIKPGHYPNMQVASHIHFSFWGCGYPPQWVDELRFEGDPYLTPAMIDEDRAHGDFATIQPLTRSSDRGLHCTVRFKLQRTCNFGAQ